MYEDATTTQAEGVDNFKPLFKKYKRRDQQLDLSDVIDLTDISFISNNSIRQVKPIIPNVTPIIGLKPVQDWCIFHFLQHKGFYVIRNPFLPGSQRYWVSRCLQDLPHPPNVTNLPAHPNLNPSTLWSSFVSDFHDRGSQAYSSSSPLRKLRWTTIGYHYHWDTKEYKEEDYTPFPQDIGVLAHYVAEVLGFSDFQAEAGIINYYHHDSSLAAHTDHSELDHDAPLISISFGQDAIFLMGGLTKALTPTPLWLHSGDICVMSGEARLAYHAVPRILPSPTSTPPPCFNMVPEDWVIVDSWAALVQDTDRQPAEGNHTVLSSCAVPPTVTQTVTVVSDTQDLQSCSIAESETEQTGSHKEMAGSCMVSSQEVKTDDGGKFSHSHVTGSIKSPAQESESQAVAFDGVISSSASSQPTKNQSDESEPRTPASDLLSNVTPSVKTLQSPSEDTDTAAKDSLLNMSFSKSHTKSLSEGDSWTVAYEKQVNDVNCQIITTLQSQDWGPFAAYLSSSRLNVNIRQVLKAGHSFQSVSSQNGSGHHKKPRIEISA